MCPQKCPEQQGLTLFRLTLRSDCPIIGTAAGVRGFFGNAFPNEILLHQHVPGTSTTLYQYPEVQYRLRDGEVMVIGIADGAGALARVYDKFDEIRLGATIYPIVERQGEILTEPFGLTTEEILYRFTSPWVPLSPKNYPRFAAARSRQEQTALLERILIGNLLSASKTLGYTAKDRITPSLNDWSLTRAEVKGTEVTGVEGEFSANFAIPDGLGLGRSVSRGNGAVERVS